MGDSDPEYDYAEDGNYDEPSDDEENLDEDEEVEETEEEIEELEEDAEEEDQEDTIETKIELEKEPEIEDEYKTFEKMLTPKTSIHKRTMNRLTKYELAAIIGYRAQQIAEGAKVYVKSDSIDPTLIAEQELEEGVIPLMIERPLPSTGINKFTYEVYRLNDLINVYKTV